METDNGAAEKPEPRFRIGQTASQSKKITEADIIGFANITGDFNPVHLDVEYATKSIFKGRIAHGAICAGLISAVLGTELPGPGCIYLSQQLKFLAPVYIGDTIEASVEVTNVREDKPILLLRTSCRNQRGEKVVDGEAAMLASASPSPAEVEAAAEALERARTLARGRVPAGEPVPASEDALASYWTDSAAIGRRVFEVWSAATRASLLSAFQLQNASLRASRALLESATPAQPEWLDRAGESVRRGQEATAELVAAGIAVLASTLPQAAPPIRRQPRGKADQT